MSCTSGNSIGDQLSATFKMNMAKSDVMMDVSSYVSRIGDGGGEIWPSSDQNLLINGKVPVVVLMRRIIGKIYCMSPLCLDDKINKTDN